MDTEWARRYLRETARLLDQMRYSAEGTPSPGTGEAEEEFNRRLLHVREVVKRVASGWERSLALAGRYENVTNRQILDEVIYALEGGAEVVRRLGPPRVPTPVLTLFTPAVWNAAKGFWRTHHRSAAVEAAAGAVNAMLQDKTGRRDISNTALVEQSFSLDPPKPGRPRLRVQEDDGSETYRSVQGGALRFGAGCFMAFRNPAAHEDEELDEQIALEQLAAFSILARWIKQAERLDAG